MHMIGAEQAMRHGQIEGERKRGTGRERDREGIASFRRKDVAWKFRGGKCNISSPFQPGLFQCASQSWFHGVKMPCACRQRCLCRSALVSSCELGLQVQECFLQGKICHAARKRQAERARCIFKGKVHRWTSMCAAARGPCTHCDMHGLCKQQVLRRLSRCSLGSAPAGAQGAMTASQGCGAGQAARHAPSDFSLPRNFLWSGKFLPRSF